MRFIGDVIGTMITTVIIAFIVIGIVVVACLPEPCEHEMGKTFSFQFEGSSATSYMKPFCKKCDHSFSYTNFRGTPSDTSYLEAIKEHSDGGEIVGGGYYTLTATVTNGDYDMQRTRVNCKVQSDGIVVMFSVEFREEFKEAVALLDTGDEITFRGKFYDTGCGSRNGNTQNTQSRCSEPSE